jgi:hypothetical protein
MFIVRLKLSGLFCLFAAEVTEMSYSCTQTPSDEDVKIVLAFLLLASSNHQCTTLFSQLNLRVMEA